MKIKEILGITLGILNVVSAIVEKIEIIKSEDSKKPKDGIKRKKFNITLNLGWD